MNSRDHNKVMQLRHWKESLYIIVRCHFYRDDITAYYTSYERRVQVCKRQITFKLPGPQ
jgi:hypothetical protein